MSTRATRFTGPSTQAVGTRDLGTVPTGERWLIRTVSLSNNSASVAASAIFYIGSAAAGSAIFRVDLAAGETQLVTPWIVANEGETLKVVIAGAGIAMSTHGYLLHP